jgi:hypothetical protein
MKHGENWIESLPFRALSQLQVLQLMVYNSQFNRNFGKTPIPVPSLGYGLDDRGSRVRFPVGGLGIFLFTTVYNGYQGLLPWG